METKQAIPQWMLDNCGYGTARLFKRDKRREVRELARALDQLQIGCAWLPSGTTHPDAIQRHLNALKDELSAKNWGR